MRILASYNLKGGVGKTAAAVNLAYLASEEGLSTLLWDLDPQAAATFYLRVEPRVGGGSRRLVRGKTPLESVIRGSDYPGLDLLPADFSHRHLDRELGATKKPVRRLRQLLAPLAERYDLVIVDCPPSISSVSESVFDLADALLVPLVPTTLSLRTLEQLVRHLESTGRGALPLLPFFCLVDRRKRLHRAIVESGQRLVPPALTAAVPSSTWVERMGERRAPVATFAAGSDPDLAFRELWDEVRERAL